MTGPQIIIAVWIGIIVLAVVLWTAGSVLSRISLGSYGSKRQAFLDAAIKSGLTHAEAMDDLILRQEMARLRRVTSDAVEANPGRWLQILVEQKQEGINRLSHRRDLARRFAQTVTGLPYNHICYPVACRAIEDVIDFGPAVVPTEDMEAALRIVRPS